MNYKIFTLCLMLVGGSFHQSFAAMGGEGSEALREEDRDPGSRASARILKTFSDVQGEFDRLMATNKKQAEEFVTCLGEKMVLAGSSVEAVNGVMKRLGAEQFYHLSPADLAGYKEHLEQKWFIKNFQTAVAFGQTQQFFNYVFNGTIEEEPRPLADGWTKAHMFTPGNHYRSTDEDRLTPIPLHLRVSYADELSHSPNGQFWDVIEGEHRAAELGTLWRETDQGYREAFSDRPVAIGILNLHNQISVSTSGIQNPFQGPMARFVLNMFEDPQGSYWYLDVREAKVSAPYRDFMGTEQGFNKLAVNAWNLFIRTLWEQMKNGRLPLNLRVLATGEVGFCQGEPGDPRPFLPFAGGTSVQHLLSLGFESGDSLKGNFGDEKLDALYKDRFLMAQDAIELRVIDDVFNPPSRTIVSGTEKEVEQSDGKKVLIAESQMVGGVAASPELRQLYTDFLKEREELVRAQQEELARKQQQQGKTEPVDESLN